MVEAEGWLRSEQVLTGAQTPEIPQARSWLLEMALRRAAERNGGGGGGGGGGTALVMLPVAWVVAVAQGPVTRWTTADVASFLGQLGGGFETIRASCTDDGIDGKALMMLEAQDFEDILSLGRLHSSQRPIDSDWRAFVAELKQLNEAIVYGLGKAKPKLPELLPRTQDHATSRVDMAHQDPVHRAQVVCLGPLARGVTLDHTIQMT